MSARAQARLAKIRAREAAASPGPWEYDNCCSVTDWDVPHEGGFSMEWIPNGEDEDTNANKHKDGSFIAHARQDIPALLALAEAASSGDPARIAEEVRAFGEGK